MDGGGDDDGDDDDDDGGDGGGHTRVVQLRVKMSPSLFVCPNFPHSAVLTVLWDAQHQIVPKNCATINSEVQRPIKPSGQGGGD